MTEIALHRPGLLPAADRGADRAIRVSTAAVVIAVAGIAAYISYWHAYVVVREYGERGVTAGLEPATIDGLVYASSMVILYSARHRVPVPRLARWMLALGILASLAVNVAQGWSHGLVGAVVAAWPAVALVGSYELLAWLIRTAATAVPDHVVAADHDGPRVDHRGTAADRAADQLEHIAVQPDQAGHGADQAAGPLGRVSAAGQGRDVNAAAVAAYRASVQAGSPLSERRLAGMFGRTSRRWARSRMAEARQSPAPA